MQLTDFWIQIWGYYIVHGRHDLPWRQPSADGTFDPYAIMVSEIMLQQTQVQRVIPKFEAFMKQFPSISSLAAAPLAEVLTAWSGLGYNRRAKFLWQAAQYVAGPLQGVFPRQLTELIKLPGVGVNTAGAIMAYAFDQPAVFLETNIRTVYIHHFFSSQDLVSDEALLPIVQDTLQVVEDQEAADFTPRTWYWALMDYGTFLKQTAGNASRRSKAYTKQSAFNGSRRQVRGAVLRRLQAAPHSQADLAKHITDERLPSVLQDLLTEKMISYMQGHYHLGDIMVQS